jgi:hypothetical protein
MPDIKINRCKEYLKWSLKNNKARKGDSIRGRAFLRGFADWMLQIINEKSNFNGSVVVVHRLKRECATGFRSKTAFIPI